MPAILPSTPKKNIQLDDYLMDSYVGNYRTTTDKNVLSIFREVDNLYINTPYEKDIKIFPETQNQFCGTTNLFGDLLINFSKSENGNVNHMSIQFAFMKIQADKIE